jgi:hypothetical protein
VPVIDVRGQFVSVVPWLGCRGVAGLGQCGRVARKSRVVVRRWVPGGVLSRTGGMGLGVLRGVPGDGGGEVFGVGPGDAAVVA